MKHHTCDKGDIGVAKVVADLLEKGIDIFTPIAASIPYDLVAYVEDKFLKIQVKYRDIDKSGGISVELRRMSVNRTNLKYTPYEDGEVDILAIYCPYTDLCYYINLKKWNSKSVTLRIEEATNNQRKGINFANDYMSFPVVASSNGRTPN